MDDKVVSTWKPIQENLNNNSSENQEKASDDDEELTCGIGKFRPDGLQVFNNSKLLLIVLCLFAFVQGFVVNGINNVNTTSYERRFGLSSSSVGIVSSSYDISAGILVLPISYYGMRGHKIKMLTIGLVIMAIGSFLMGIPHFTTGLYEWGQNKTDLCSTGNVTTCVVKDSSLPNYLYVLIGGQLLHGAGGTTLYTVGVACIDDNVMPGTSALYVSLLYAFAALGPAVGYLLGGYFVDIYVDFDSISSPLSNTDPRWVGAWWIGFVMAGALAVLLIAPLLSFPRELHSAKEVRTKRVSEAHTQAKQAEIGNSFKEAPLVLWSLLKNPTLVLIALATSSEGILLSGFATFIPKFIQNQYGQTASFSAMLTGLLVVPGAVSGQVIGGYICRRFQLKIPGMLKLALVTCLLCVATSAGFWAQCAEDTIAGVTSRYEKGTSDELLPDVTSVCNSQCGCTLETYFPICGVDNIQYFSPCHAGCRRKEDTNYFDCGCINRTLSAVNVTHDAIAGNCSDTCGMMYVFLCLFFITVTLTFVSGTPSTMVVLRCVPEAHKTFATGVNWTFARFLGTIPGPILFGTVIDSVCLIWEEKCNERGSCWIYDNAAMGRNIFLVGMGVKVVSSVFFFLTLLMYKAPPDPEITELEVPAVAETDVTFKLDPSNGTLITGDISNEKEGVDNPAHTVLY